MNLEKVRVYKVPSVTQSFARRDSMLYALSLGYGSDPLDPEQLAYVYEKEQKVVPSQCVTVGYPGFWQQDPDLEIDWVKLLNAQYTFHIHKAFPPEGSMRSETRIVAVDDKGKGKGAVLHIERVLNGDGGEHYATIEQALFLRGDGGFGGFGTPPPAADEVPNGSPDRVVELPVPRNAALLYRLNGDYNPVHSDPEIARKAGFGEPIMHGLYSLGMACRAALSALCDGDPQRIATMGVRFVSPVYPGDSLRIEFYGDGANYQWRARVPGRDRIVLDRGFITLRS